MAYSPLAELRVAWADGIVPASAIVPDVATAGRLAGRRMLARPVGDQLLLLAETDAAGALLVPVAVTLRLAFALRLPAAIAALVEPVAAPLILALTPAQVAAAMRGKIRTTVAATLTPRAALWCYDIVTDLPAPAADWRIVRAAGAGDPAPSFTGRATELAADDRPGLRTLRFVSDAPFAASPDPVRGLELHAGEHRLLAALPNPPPGAAVRIGDRAALAATVRITAA